MATKKKKASAKSKAKAKTKAQAKGTWGGARPGAGRPRTSDLASHAPRPPHVAKYPVHATLPAEKDVPTLRSQKVLAELLVPLARSTRDDFRLVAFRLDRDRVQVIVEADDEVALSLGMQAMSIRLARGINRAVARAGHVWRDRYSAQELGSAHEARDLVAKLHAGEGSRGGDPYSSARFLDAKADGEACPIAPAKTAFARDALRRG